MELAKFLEAIHLHTRHKRDVDGWTVSVVTYSPGSVGPTPGCAVKQVCAGFDWDARRLLIYPERELTQLSAEDVSAIRKSVSAGSSWHAYEAQKKLRQRILELEAEVAALKAK